MADTTDEEFFERFADHVGQPAFRYAARPRELQDGTEVADSSWPPQTYDLCYTFQVYVTFDLALNKHICKAICTHLIDLDESQIQPPIWEFYVAKRAVLNCVDHSRHEITHRRSFGAIVPRIRSFCRADYDDRRLGFAFIIDNERGWKVPIEDAQFMSTRFPDKTGPLWVHFDVRLPSDVVDIDRAWLVDDDDEEGNLDQLEMQVRRIQGKDANSQLLSMYNNTLIAMKEDTEETDTSCGH